MSNKHDVRDYLHDIVDAIDDIMQFTQGITFEQFQSDKKTVYAVVRCLEVIGEAVKKIPKAQKDKYPDIPWREIAGMRNKLIHEYFGVDVDVLWDTVQADIDQVKQAAIKMLEA